jgi:hypothetical protein
MPVVIVKGTGTGRSVAKIEKVIDGEERTNGKANDVYNAPENFLHDLLSLPGHLKTGQATYTDLMLLSYCPSRPVVYATLGKRCQPGTLVGTCRFERPTLVHASRTLPSTAGMVGGVTNPFLTTLLDPPACYPSKFLTKNSLVDSFAAKLDCYAEPPDIKGFYELNTKILFFIGEVGGFDMLLKSLFLVNHRWLLEYQVSTIGFFLVPVMIL